MDVASLCPLQVGSIVWRPRPDAWALTVVCKATLTLRPGESPLAREQDEVNEIDGHWNDDPQRSLHFASDLSPFKRNADVLLTGHAFAPRAVPVRSLLARLVVAGVDKSVEVFGDRAFTLDGALREAVPFTRASLRWERSAGGPGTSNPVGVRTDAPPPDVYGARMLPNLQPPGLYVTTPGDCIEPIGFGPIAPPWRTRAAHLYGHAAGWLHQGWAERVLPSDIDARYFNAAPPDQQVESLRADERIVLENLHVDHSRLVTNLEPVTPRAVVERAGRAPEEVPLRCDTLSIDTDRGTCSLVWRGQVGLWRPDDAGRVVVTMTRGPLQGARDQGAETIVGVLTPAGPMLPFGIEGPAGGYPNARLDQAVNQGDASITLVALPEPAASALPFVQRSPWVEGQLPSWPLPEDALEPRGERDGTGTIFGAFVAPSGEVMPFPSSTPPVKHPLPSLASSPARDEAVLIPVAPWQQEPAGAPPTLPEAPPMIGPLATPEMVARAEQVNAAPPVVEEPTPKAAPEKPAPPPELPLDVFPIERCGEIAASMARRKPDAGRILEENGLDPATWEALDRHWAEAIREENKRGRATLLRRYDQAYVGRLEEERGPILVEEYARFSVATERGMAAEVLAKLTLPNGASMRIERVWLERTIEDVALATKVSAAVEAARAET